MSLFSWIWKSVVAWVVLLIAITIAAAVVAINAPSAPHQFAWLLLTDFLTVAAVAVAAIRAEWRGLRLGIAAVTIPLLIMLADVIEGSIFLGHSGIPWTRLALHALISYALVAPAWGMIFSLGREEPVAAFYPVASRPMGERIWKYALSAFSYLFLYYLAGMIIFPFVRSFYATQTLPLAKTIIALQLLLRGPIFVAVCLLLLRMVRMRGWRAALLVGLLFTIISGVAPLLMPNPYFPDTVRWAHFCEVTSENFVFGAFVGWLWGEPKRAGLSAMTQAA